MLVSAHTPSNVPKAAEVSRTRSNQSNVVPAPRQGPGYAASSSGKVNKVLFTIPWSVHFGESLSVSGEGSELGSWNPDESLPLKWNEGNLWAAGTARYHFRCFHILHALCYHVLIDFILLLQKSLFPRGKAIQFEAAAASCLSSWLILCWCLLRLFAAQHVSHP